MNIDDFLDLENKYDLLNIEIEGIKIWRYVRFSIWNYKICTKTFDLANSHPKTDKNCFQTLKNIMYILMNSLSHRRIKSSNYDICFISHERRVKNEGYYECIYTEQLTETFANSITLEQPFGYNHLKPTRNKNIIYTDYIIWIGEILCTFFIKLRTKKYQDILNQVRRGFQKPFDDLEKIYGITLNKNYLYEIMARKIIIVKTELPYYDRLINKISPRIIIEVEHYGTQCMIINQIAADRGIKTVELQHGTMYKEHAAYQYETDSLIEQLPQYLFTFSEYWNKIIKMPLKSTKVIATGFPYFEKMVENTKKSNCKQIDKENILFISQGTISKYLVNLAIELNEKLDKTKFRIIYKFHPSEYIGWAQRYPELRNSEIEVVDSSDVKLYELFACSRIQIGVYSTAIYEGIGFGLETYIYRIAHADAMQNLVQMGAAEYIESADDLLGKLEVKKNMKVVKDILWKNNAFEKICDEISRLLSVG